MRAATLGIVLFGFVTSPLRAQEADWALCNNSLVNPQDGITGCTRIIENSSQTAKQRSIGFARRGIAYEAFNDIQRCLSDMGEAIRLDPDFPNWRYQRARILFEKADNPQLAIEDLNAALILRPDEPSYLSLREQAYNKIQKPSVEARALLRSDTGQAVTPAAALTMRECSKNYQAAKTAGTLNGRKWNDFRREECNATAAGVTVPPSFSSAVRLPSKPSFDCLSAKSASARLICSDGEISKADGDLGEKFKAAMASRTDEAAKKQLLNEQLAWIRDRNRRCGLGADKANVPTEQLIPAKGCLAEAIGSRRDTVALLLTNTENSHLESHAIANKQPLSQEEVDAFRKFMSSWSPPPGMPSLDVHFRLKQDGTIDGAPEVLSTGAGPTFEAAKSGAVRTILQAQPFKMFRPESYDAWKDLIVTFEAPTAQTAK